MLFDHCCALPALSRRRGGDAGEKENTEERRIRQRMTEDNDKINGRRKSGVLWYIFALIFVFLAIFSTIFISSRAYAATIPEIFMGIFSDEYKGSNTGIAQQPATGDIITTSRTVVIKDSKWQLRPGYEIKEAETSDASKIKLVKTKKRYVRIKALETGTAKVTITGSGGETSIYELIVENPQVKSLKVVDFVRLKESRYITGVKYLKPTSVSSSKRKIAQVYKSTDGKNIINVFGSGTTKITVRYGDYKRKGTIKAKLPYMASKDVKLSTRPKKIRVKNMPKGWTPVYYSTDSKVAVCSADGYVAPKGNGTCTIYTRIGNTYLICHVTVGGFK